jgi:HK97 gp10 family phage protein
MQTSFQITGMKETLEVFQLLENEIGDKKARSKVLIPAVKEAMKPVLVMAKSTAPYDDSTNHLGVHLRDTLTIVGRKPTRNDKKSKYINQTDTVIAIVTSRPIPKKLKTEMWESTKHLYKGKGEDNKEFNKARKNFYLSKGSIYDGRAMFQEFGTARMSARPFMRPALESQAISVSTKLGEILKNKIEQYRSKNV